MSKALAFLPRLVGRGVAFTAACVTTWTARLAFAAVEGVAFTLGRRGARVILVAELVVLTYHAGPQRAVSTAVYAAALCTAGRTMWLLCHTTRSAHSAKEGLESIWDWQPPLGDDLQTGAWHVLRSLAQTAGRLDQEYPAIDELLSQEALQPAQLALRLYFLYALNSSEPEWDSFDQAAAQAGAAAEYGAVAKGDLEALVYYRPLACFLYDIAADSLLAPALAESGYTLCFASYESDLATSCPAYFLALHEGRREVLLVVRGTYSPEDVFADLLATGEPYEGGPYSCHSGMYRGAVALRERFGALLLAAAAQGYQVTLVGHSLGAGVSSILACMLKERGAAANLRCYAFETPACMDLSLAESCADVVLSTVTGDDIVPRMSIQLFIKLLEELAAFDWKQAAEKEGLPSSLSVVEHLSQLLSWGKQAAGDTTSQGTSSASTKAAAAAVAGEGGPAAALAAAAAAQGEQEGAAAAAAAAVVHPGEPIMRSMAARTAAKDPGLSQEGEKYNPYVPGRIVYIYRRQPTGAPLPCTDCLASYIYRRCQVAVNGGGLQEATETRALEASSTAGAAEEANAEVIARHVGQVALRATHPALRRIRLTSHALMDHFIDTRFFMAALTARSAPA